jgi:hypothetical protein
VGSRVMLKRNLVCQKEMSLVNGSCGTVIGFAERFAVDQYDVFRPVEDCIMPHFVRAEFLSKAPYGPNYQVPMDPIVGAPESVKQVHFLEGARKEGMCPLKEFQRLCYEATHLSSKTMTPSRFHLYPTSKLANFDNYGFRVLPVVQFENGELVVVQPHQWSINESSRAAARAAKKRGEAPNTKQQPKVIMSRLQIPLIPAFATSIHARKNHFSCSSLLTTLQPGPHAAEAGCRLGTPSVYQQPGLCRPVARGGH